MGGAVERVQAVAERGVGLGVEVAVAVQGEAHRGVAGPSRDFLGTGAGGDPQGAEAAADQLAVRPAWEAARVVKANPDKAQRAVRARAVTSRGVV